MKLLNKEFNVDDSGNHMFLNKAPSKIFIFLLILELTLFQTYMS